MSSVRQVPLSIYMALVMLGLSLWTSDVRGLYLALALLGVVAAQVRRTRTVARQRRPDLRTWDRADGTPSRLDVLLAPFVWMVLAFGVGAGGLAGWAAAGNVIAASGAAAMGGAVALLLLGVISIFAALVSARLWPPLSHDDDSRTPA